MTYAEIIAAWNAQADHMNQWPVLSEQEKVEWTWRCALEKAAKVCDEKSDHMGKRAAEEDCDADDAISLRSTAWIVKNCATAIRAMKDKP